MYTMLFKGLLAFLLIVHGHPNYILSKASSIKTCCYACQCLENVNKILSKYSKWFKSFEPFHLLVMDGRTDRRIQTEIIVHACGFIFALLIYMFWEIIHG